MQVEVNEVEDPEADKALGIDMVNAPNPLRVENRKKNRQTKSLTT
jgi:hypothetical protein